MAEGLRRNGCGERVKRAKRAKSPCGNLTSSNVRRSACHDADRDASTASGRSFELRAKRSVQVWRFELDVSARSFWTQAAKQSTVTTDDAMVLDIIIDPVQTILTALCESRARTCATTCAQTHASANDGVDEHGRQERYCNVNFGVGIGSSRFQRVPSELRAGAPRDGVAGEKAPSSVWLEHAATTG